MRILVTGVMGFIGRYLLESLRGRNEVFALAREQDLVDVPDGVEPVVHDLAVPLDHTRLPEEIDLRRSASAPANACRSVTRFKKWSASSIGFVVRSA